MCYNLIGDFMKKIIVIILSLFLLTTDVYAIKPTKDFYVNDYADILSSETENFILNNSVNLATKTTAQIVVITVPSLEGESLEEYATDTFRKFEIGDKEKNNGLLILIALKERKCRIEVGYGLEDTLTDGKTGRIQDEYMIPYFKNDNFDEGILNGYKALYKEIAEKYNMETDVSPTSINTEEDGILAFTSALLVGKIIYTIILFSIELERKGKIINSIILEALTILITLGSYSCGTGVDCLWLLGFGTIINIAAIFIHFDCSSGYYGGGGYSKGHYSGGSHSSGGHHGGGGRSGGGGSSRGF